ncbi:MAG TPA: hypothetical protein VGR02_09155 [Thermoanaerobaculia bacterium]|nr:hypothetical protein [Thermoanaerobaculia bacterium]
MAALLLCAATSFAATPAKPAPAPAAKPAAPAKPYHLELEANPAAPFPFLSRFGVVHLHVYPSGVRADTTWLNGISRSGTDSITVLNPALKMYTEVPISEIGNLLAKIGGMNTRKTFEAIANVEPPVKDKVGGLDVMRYRARYTQTAWIDVWTTTAVPQNPQLKAIVDQVVYNISPGTGALTRFIPGTPVQVELNFTNFKKVQLVTLKSLTMDATGEADALAMPAAYAKAPLLDEVWK